MYILQFISTPIYTCSKCGLSIDPLNHECLEQDLSVSVESED